MSDAPPAAVPVLTDGTVVLRALGSDDLDAVVVQSRDPLVRRWSLTIPLDYTRANAEAFLALAQEGWVSGERWQWAVEADGRFAGLVDLTHCGAGVREIGYVAHPASRGRGHLTRATRLVVAHAFARGCPLVVWHAAAGNAASRRVAWRTGFTIAPGQTRILRDGVRREGWSGTLAPDDPGTPRTRWVRPSVLRGSAGRVAVRLRAWHEDDGPSLPTTTSGPPRSWCGDGVDLPTPSSYDTWHARLLAREAAGEALSWAVTTDPPPGGGPEVVLGGVRLTTGTGWTGPGRATASGWLWPAARGGGVAQSALEAVIAHALLPQDEGGLGLTGVDARVAADDRPALRLLRRVGLRDTGPGGTSGVTLEVDAGDDRTAQAVEPLEVAVLETSRLRLRPYRDDDVPGPDDGPDEVSRRFLPAAAHPDAAAYPAWLSRQRRSQDAGQSVAWCVAERTGDRAVGLLTVFRMEPLPGRFDAEVGYWLVPGARGRGYLAEALAAVVEHAFTPRARGGLGLTRLHASTDVDNVASQGVLEQVGFRRWGADRSAWRRADGVLVDGVHLELLATDDRVDRRSTRPGLRAVTLEGDGVRLRALRPSDAARIEQACNDPRTRLWLGNLPAPYLLEDALDHVTRATVQAATGEALDLAVAAVQDDTLLGVVSLLHLQSDPPETAEVGYWAHPDARGRGVTTRAVRLAVRHAFAPVADGGLGLRRLVLRAAAGNHASQAVAASAGFVVTGRQRRAAHLGDGTWDDLVDHDLLADEWDAREAHRE